MIGKVEIVVYYWIGSGSVLGGLDGIKKVSEMYELKGQHVMGDMCSVRYKLVAGAHLADMCVVQSDGQVVVTKLNMIWLYADLGLGIGDWASPDVTYELIAVMKDV